MEILINLHPDTDFEKNLFLEKYIKVLKTELSESRQKVGKLEGELVELSDSKSIEGEYKRSKDTLNHLNVKHKELKDGYAKLLETVIKLQKGEKVEGFNCVELESNKLGGKDE